jgi:hypothetical protein
MWFISHNATEIVDFRFNNRDPPETVANESVAEGRAFGFATWDSVSAIERSCRNVRSRDPVERVRLRAGSREACGGDGDDLGQPTPDPGRRATQK